MFRYFLVCLFFPVIFSPSQVISQSIFLQTIATGGSHNNTDLQMSWTVGESIVESFKNNELILDQGFHQGYYLPPENLIVDSLTINQGDSECFAALSYIGVSNLEVKDGGAVTFIAGNRITFSDPVIVNYGGVLHAKISENGEYCEHYRGLLNSTDNVEYDSFVQPFTEPTDTNDQFNIFPNPTKHYLNIKASNIYHGAPLLLEVYSLTGEKVESMIMTASSSTVDLSALKAGMYILRIYHDNDIWIRKIGKL